MLSPYEKLCRKIGKIEPMAALYMRTEAKKLPNFNSSGTTLRNSFVWFETPQGHPFWEDLWKQLNK